MNENFKNYPKLDFSSVVLETVRRILAEKNVCTLEEFNKILEKELEKQKEIYKQYPNL